MSTAIFWKKNAEKLLDFSWIVVKKSWQRWDSNPRSFELVPKTSALDHSATLPLNRSGQLDQLRTDRAVPRVDRENCNHQVVMAPLLRLHSNNIMFFSSSLQQCMKTLASVIRFWTMPCTTTENIFKLFLQQKIKKIV